MRNRLKKHQSMLMVCHVLKEIKHINQIRKETTMEQSFWFEKIKLRVSEEKNQH